MTLVHAMETTAGRVARVIVGLALIGLGAGLGGGWWALFAVGFIPLAAGAFDFCLLAPAFGSPLRHLHHGQ